jgi:uncharacterized membrane protein YqjE
MLAEASVRSTGELIKDGFDHVHEILRSEVALARAEIREEARVAGQGAILAGAALIFAALGLSFILWTAFWALASTLPQWASAAVVGVGALLVGGILAIAAKKRFRDIRPPETAARTLKENIEWIKKRAQ